MKVKILKRLVLLASVMFILLSCNPGKNLKSLVYLNETSDSNEVKIVRAFEPQIQAGDRLAITVSALNPASAAPYNLSSGSNTGAVATVSSGYLVETDGTIAFPQLGKIKAAGLTRLALINQLTPLLEKYLRDPVITVQYLNFKVTVLGEVNRPGAISLADGKMTIIEAIGESGDLTIYGRRDNVLVMREKDGKRDLGRVNLTSTKIFSSPYYQLQQNDVVYVEMTSAKAAASDQTLSRNISIAASIVSILTALIVVVLNITR